jgi:hypothetical protein
MLVHHINQVQVFGAHKSVKHFRDVLDELNRLAEGHLISTAIQRVFGKLPVSAQVQIFDKTASTWPFRL